MKKLIAFAPMLLLLAACTPEDRLPEGTPSMDAGEAVAHNIAAQLVNPQAPSPDAAMSYNGERAALGQDRYVKDAVIRPATTTVGSGGGGGGGGGGSGGGSGGGGTSAGSGGAATQ